MKVLLIEDDIQLNTTITNFLKSIKYDVTSLTDGEVAIDTIDNTNFNLYIIDINIPNVNGLDIVKYIRQKDTTTPIIIITASMELDNFQTAFKNGCNEYIKKPFFLEELEIRINNLLEKPQNNTIQISDSITYDMEYEELKIDDEIIKLRKKERKLLTVLLQNINKTVDTDIIQNYVWENEIRESYPLRQLVNELRKKFNNGEKFIFSDIGIGYRFEIK
ncbi:MAG: response regulator transcription factor [Campylobacterota bacterium]|nr:response regulator transcription factor [Campylobacterota bacterium]